MGDEKSSCIMTEEEKLEFAIKLSLEEHEMWKLDLKKILTQALFLLFFYCLKKHNLNSGDMICLI